MSVQQLERFTIGEVRRRLAEQGIARSASGLRKMESRGVVRPSRAIGQDRRLYTEQDVEAIATAIRDGQTSRAMSAPRSLSPVDMEAIQFLRSLADKIERGEIEAVRMNPSIVMHGLTSTIEMHHGIVVRQRDQE